MSNVTSEIISATIKYDNRGDVEDLASMCEYLSVDFCPDFFED